jgi:hypothetical protein
MIIPIPIFGDVAWHSVAMLGAYAVPLAGEMSRKPTSGGDETEGWQLGSAVGKKPKKARHEGPAMYANCPLAVITGH